jgi:hypothetical protein
VCRLLEGRRLEVWSLELVQRWEGGIHINKGRVGKDRGSKEMDGCPLTGLKFLRSLQSYPGHNGIAILKL